MSKVTFHPGRPASAPPSRQANTHVRPAPAPPVSAWAQRAAKAVPKPAPMLEVQGDWFCDPPYGDEQFIADTSLRIAQDFGCDFVGIRSAIHNTATYRDLKGSKAYKMAPWHFTAEFRSRTNGRWMSAHIYTNTRRATTGRYRYETNGLQKLEMLKRDNIKTNPERFVDVRPMCTMMTVKGEGFGTRFSSAGYKPKSW